MNEKIDIYETVDDETRKLLEHVSLIGSITTRPLTNEEQSIIGKEHAEEQHKHTAKVVKIISELR